MTIVWRGTGKDDGQGRRGNLFGWVFAMGCSRPQLPAQRPVGTVVIRGAEHLATVELALIGADELPGVGEPLEFGADLTASLRAP